MRLFVDTKYEDNEHTIYNEKMERVGGSMTMAEDQVKASIAASIGISENKLQYVADMLHYEVWQFD